MSKTIKARLILPVKIKGKIQPIGTEVILDEKEFNLLAEAGYIQALAIVKPQVQPKPQVKRNSK